MQAMQSTPKSVSSRRRARRDLCQVTIGSLCVLTMCSAYSYAADAVTAITPGGNTHETGTVASGAFTLPAATSSAPVPAMSIAAPPLPMGQELISIDFADASVAEVLSMIAKQSNVNIFVNDEVTNRVKNLTLNNVPVEEAIETIVRGSNLTVRKTGSTYIISKGVPGSVAAETSLQTSASTAANPFEGLPGVNLPPGASIPPLTRSLRNDDDDAERVFRSIRVHNVKPSIMAYWLDPAHNEMPAEFRQSQERLEKQGSDLDPNKRSNPSKNGREANDRIFNPTTPGAYGQFNNPYAPYNPYVQSNPQFGGGGGGRGGGGRGGGNNQGGGGRGGGGRGGGGAGGGGDLGSAAGLIPLPPGVESLTAIDPQNALLVRGTEEGIDAIRDVIRYLDRPIGQVEIEAQFVQVQRRDLDEFGLSFTNTRDRGRTEIGGGEAPIPVGPGGISVDIVRGNLTAALAAISQRGTGRIIDSPRITTFNNLTAQIRSVTNIPVITTDIDRETTDGVVLTTITQEIEFIPVGSILTVTPTIHQDGTITIAMQPLVAGETADRVRFGSPALGNSGEVPIIGAQQIDTISNVKDGETLAIGGLRTRRQTQVGGGIPILSRLPIIGSLFRSRSNRDVEAELIIFVTARIVRRIDDPVAGT